LNAIEELGENVSSFKNETAPNPGKSFFKLNFKTFTIDFLPELPGLSKFRDAYEKRESVSLDDVHITFIDFDDLITNKQVMARAKDITDVDELNKIRRKDI
jgi:hypothetical protein